MTFVLVLLLQTSFETTIDRAFTLIQENDSSSAASLLDQAQTEYPDLFKANNLHYLRGRIAEDQRDWQRAVDEFKRIGADNPLYAQAVWHAARASARLGNDGEEESFFDMLPRDFPSDLKIQLAHVSSDAVALKIYQNMTTREARFQRARLAGDDATLRVLIREMKEDDIGLQAARLTAKNASTAREQMDIAAVYSAHREFDDALPLYREAAEDSSYAAEARYQIARIYFLREDYKLAIESYEAIARDFKGTDWEEQSEYQIASCYWRLGDLRQSEKAYVDYISKYRARGDEGAARNLIDVYRALGENQKAITWLDRALIARSSPTTRQVLLFTKAKVLFTQKKYAAAQRLFQQLSVTRLRTAAGGTTKEEAQYFDALSLAKSGRKTAAAAIWKRLARDPLTYYGRRAVEQLGQQSSLAAASICSPPQDDALLPIKADIEGLSHPIRNEMDPSSSIVSELLFLRLWDEAAFWIDREQGRPDYRIRAKIAYLGGRYNRAINYAERLPRSENSTRVLMYPAGYRTIVCDAAATNNVDPLWLHAIIWQESRYNPNARSGAAARGLMQFIPETAQSIGSELGLSDFSVEQLYDPAINIRMGARLWSSLMEKLRYPEMALAAYNGGPTNVERWKKKGMASPDDLDMFVADIGFTETKRYVMAVFAARAAYGVRD
jgi:soluble lytic murein transglycosylase-like protein/lipopolysaccharide biosynthesis regulator YciM